MKIISIYRTAILRMATGLLLALSITACGGGGGDGGSNPGNDNAEWDGSNWDQTNWQ